MRTALEAAYVLTVAAVAACGFATASTATILLAALLTLPTSIPAVMGYYLAYGLLAQVTGAHPSSSSGSGWCSPGGSCHTSSSGDPAAWFTLTTDLIGVLALTVAARVNVMLLRWLSGMRRSPVDDDFAGTPHRW
jgi:hypothetical protein